METVLWVVHGLKALTRPESLNAMAGSLGPWLYALLFGIIFAETGLVVTPFLPGDSLLFAVGAVAAHPETPISLPLVAVLLIVAAVLGDAVNYFIGYRVGPKVFSRDDSWLLNRKHLVEAQKFYDRHGAKTIILARFVPIIRTFAPFVAGIGKMNYFRFAAYNVVGGVAWVLICLLAGYFFGGLAFVQRNFELVLIAIIFISVLPALVEVTRGWLASRRERDATAVDATAIVPAAVSPETPAASEAAPS
jgi:membrane-associated protein